MSKASEIIVRPLAQEDWGQWRILWRQYLEFYETTLSEEIYESSFARMLSGSPHEFEGIVATNDTGELVGLVHFLFHRHGWKVENVCFLQDLFVADSARKKGVGRKLIEAVYSRADEEGSPTVYWNTQHFNAEARKLYDKIGTLTPFIKYNR
jgi:GNAT superfamily N-acetyltransferase